jgi:hypothetical protein
LKRISIYETAAPVDLATVTRLLTRPGSELTEFELGVRGGDTAFSAVDVDIFHYHNNYNEKSALISGSKPFLEFG